VVKTKADFLQALLELEAKEGVLKRMQATADVVAGRQLREAERALREARIRLFEQQQRLSNLGLTVQSQALLAAAEDQVVERLRTAGIPSAALRGLDRETLPNSLLPLFAPLRGQVVKRDSMVGELITSDQVQFVVADTKRLWLLLDVRLEDAHLLALAQQVVFQPDGSSAVAHGHISWIRPGVDQKTRTVRVRADVDGCSGALRPNTFGTGRIIVRPSYPALAVPTAAIQREGEQRLVFVQVGGNVFEGRRIEPGVRDAGFTEIRSGLRSGDAVVIAGSHVLKSEILRSRLANP
jgi:RND family efflux transporter MFP subunit